MNLRKKIDFKVFDEGYVSYDDRVREVKHTQGTTPEEFVRIYEKLSNKYNLSITEEFLARFYNKELSLDERQKLPFPYINHLIGFMLDTDYLLEKKIDIKPLIREFNECNNSSELHHTVHLSSLAAIYASVGYSIEFPIRSKKKKTPDLIISGIPADLKVIKPSNKGKLYNEKGEIFESKLREDLCYDVGKAIENRLCIGIEQADLVFIDLAAKSLPFMFLGNILQNFPSKYSVFLPEPKRFRVVFCCITMLPSNLNRRKKGLPYSFYGTYVDMDPNLWNFVRQSDTRITHKKGEGKYIL